MIIRQYKQSDLDTLANLFYQTVHNVNCADYTEEQLCAWTNSPESLKTKQENLSKQYTLLAEIDGETVGFGSIDKNGCLDFLYVHKDYQRQGVATALCDELEKNYSTITTYASKTAKPFFEGRGYYTVKEQEVERFGIKLKNYEMRKSCSKD